MSKKNRVQTPAELLAQLQGEEDPNAIERPGPHKKGDQFAFRIDAEHARNSVDRDPQHCTGALALNATGMIIPGSVEFSLPVTTRFGEKPWVNVRWAETDDDGSVLHLTGRAEPYDDMRKVIDLTDSLVPGDLERLVYMLEEADGLVITVTVTDVRQPSAGKPRKREAPAVNRVRKVARREGERIATEEPDTDPEELTVAPPAWVAEIAAEADDSGEEYSGADVMDAWDRGVKTGARKAAGTHSPRPVRPRTVYRRGGGYTKPEAEAA